MEIHEIRRRRLATLLGDKHGASADLAAKCGLDESYISQLKNGHRQMGERTARKIEKGAGVYRGYLDEDDSDESVDAVIDEIRRALSKATWVPAENREQFIGILKAMRG